EAHLDLTPFPTRRSSDLFPRRFAMWSRRSFLRLTGAATGAAFAAPRYGIEQVAAATAAVDSRSPEDIAADEDYWREIQFAFTLRSEEHTSELQSRENLVC